MDLARQMIQFSGLSVRDHVNPDGDIEIKSIGLRPGEKLYEELIDAESQVTRHPLIYRARETLIDSQILWPQLEELREACLSTNVDSALKILSGLVPEWTPSNNS